jgi:hypothetical protein
MRELGAKERRMEALDLRTAPPREPRAELSGIPFLPRSIDKVRATFPGGSLGAYQIEGFTIYMLEHLGISLEAFVEAVREASTDEAVAAFVVAHTDATKIAAWREYVFARQPFHGDRAKATEMFPFLADRQDLVYSLDVLAEDDRLAFERA